MKFAAYAFEEKYSHLKFFADKSLQFITALCPLMRADEYAEDEYLFRDGDQVEQFFFMKSGGAQFTLPEWDNLPYINIAKYNHFGFIDLVASSLKEDFPLSEWWANYHSLKRGFSIRATERTEVFFLTFESLAS